MENNRTFELISGDFDAHSARTLILSMYTEKIKYHNQLLLRLKLAKAPGTQMVEAKIAELRETSNQLAEYLLQLAQSNKRCHVHAGIEINVLN